MSNSIFIQKGNKNPSKNTKTTRKSHDIVFSLTLMQTKSQKHHLACRWNTFFGWSCLMQFKILNNYIYFRFNFESNNKKGKNMAS